MTTTITRGKAKIYLLEKYRVSTVSGITGVYTLVIVVTEQ
jgi:hypothetical protein